MFESAKRCFYSLADLIGKELFLKLCTDYMDNHVKKPESPERFRPTGILNARWPPAAESFEGTNCGATPRKVPVSNAQRSKMSEPYYHPSVIYEWNK